MSEELIVRHGSPTLPGLKTGSLFSCACPDGAELCRTLRSWNRRLAPKGVRALGLRLLKGRALIYVYRPARLARDLERAEVRALLADRGYPTDATACVRTLCQRLRRTEEFPHEIGLFLSYPPEDVRGFIENRAGGFKCVGCWKVYGDAAAARALFGKYSHCTRVYCDRYARGVPLERLTVAG